ncbi:hypothetical protein [Vibrio harveyi]|uniref:hypothetical protein n=1 Tax=Vibrio harveyi TaxID=669 RepID=UPI003AAA74D6
MNKNEAFSFDEDQQVLIERASDIKEGEATLIEVEGQTYQERLGSFLKMHAAKAVETKKLEKLMVED